ncbi:phosphoribosyltransferase-like protein [Kluyvera intermedia]|uniref:phosphoribosyltransferase-like protein n=1 Tax=Kluyvera intermedia TaxID=61648 RepID=UPI00372D86FD
MTDRDLMGQIAVKLNDYRYPPQGGMCIAHVNRWIGQFELNDRRFVLEETDRLLGIGYFSESDYRRVASSIATDEANESFFQTAAFLDIQNQGASQSEFLDLLQEDCEEELNVVTRTSRRRRVSSFDDFIYVDDVSFSGAKAINDLTWFIENFDLQNINILVYFLGAHTYATWKIKDQLERTFSERNISVGVGGDEFVLVENQRRNSSNSEVLWPKEQSVSIPEWADGQITYQGTYRNGYIANDFFPDEQRRDRFEAILTKVGFDILSHSQNPSAVIKPLGFSTFNGVGFGGTIFTFRNCPNNTPLAYWWGTYLRRGNGALDCWYPLMKRNVYNQ